MIGQKKMETRELMEEGKNNCNVLFSKPAETSF